MATFVGRDTELESLDRRYRSRRFECVIVYGRRRIGKTALINRFIHNRPAIFFAATENNIDNNLAALSASITLYKEGEHALDTAPVYKDFAAAIEAVFALAARERLILVIDEYPYLAKADPSISSVLQHAIDRHKDDSQLMLILSGSSMSFMERQVLGYQSPLYGRRTAQIKVETFDYLTARGFTPAMIAEDAAVVYGLTGGIPQYLLQFDDTESLRENLRWNVLDPSCYLFEEPSKLLQEELRRPQEYNGIIESVAAGASRFNDIATASHIDSGTLPAYLTNLLDLRILSKETPFGHPTSKKTIYRLADSFFRFWYRYIPPNMSLIQSGHADLAADRIMRDLPRFMGQVFEDMCLQWLWANNATDRVPLLVLNAGRWWGGDPRTHRQEEIDIVATGEPEGVGLYCECKWRNEPVGVGELELLKYRAELLPEREKHYMVFSKSGFTQDLEAIAADDDSVRLVSFADISGEVVPQ